jgi:hypothetical protein
VSGVAIVKEFSTVEALLHRAHSLLMEQGIFCGSDLSEKTRLYSQETVYNYNHFMMHVRFKGGHTYMTRKERDGYVRVNPELLSVPAFKVSVQCKALRSTDTTGDAEDPNAKKAWQCILLVAKWWATCGPCKSLQAELQLASLHLAGQKFTVGGGPVFHVLVALVFAYCCGFETDYTTDIVFETYATKKLYSACVDTTSPISKHTADAAATKLLSALKYTAPCQIMQLRTFFEGGAASLLLTESVQLTVGVGCTFKAVDANAPDVHLLPVVQCVECPWAVDEPYFRAVTGNRMDEFLPSYHQREWSSFPVYGGTFPTALQPVTAVATGKARKPCLKRKITGGTNLLSAQILRVQQYAPHTRLAEGQCGLQTPSAAVHGTLPVLQDPDTLAVSINLQSCREQVQKFAATATRHIEALNLSGGVARVEVAVQCQDQATYTASLCDAVYDTVWIAQNSTRSYNLSTWCDLVRFYLGGLLARIEYAIEAMAPIEAPGGPFEDVQRRAAVAEVAADVFGAITTFYSGRGTFQCRQRALTRTAYMHGRPIHCRLRPDLQRIRCEVLHRASHDWLTAFYSLLDGDSDSPGLRDIPDFLPVSADHVTPSFVMGFACPHCFAVFAPGDASDYTVHPCRFRDPNDPRCDDWIPLSSQPFIRHHQKLASKLSNAQKIFLSEVRGPGLHNLVIMGGAGSGKTTAVCLAREECYMQHGMLSTITLGATHVAASGVGGRTLHSFLGLGPVSLCEAEPAAVVSKFWENHKAEATEMQNNLRYIFLDEVGMLAGRALDLLDQFLRGIRTNAVNRGRLAAFGGIKVILVGDSLQNCPIEKAPAEARSYGRFFQSKVFSEPGAFRVVTLKEMFRSPYLDYLEFQEASRLGGKYITAKDWVFAKNELGRLVPDSALHNVHRHMHALLETELATDNTGWIKGRMQKYFVNYSERTGSRPEQPDEDSDPPPSAQSQPYVVCFENAEIFALNKAYVASFVGSVRFHATDEWPSGVTPHSAGLQFALPPLVTVAVGMRVCFVRNDIAPGVHRNTLAIVERIDDADATVYVRLADPPLGQQAVTFAVRKATEVVLYTPQGTSASTAAPPLPVHRTQFPFRSCAAGTNYTVQGQTLVQTQCVFNNGRATKTHFGAAFTVLSRHTDPAYIRPLFPLLAGDFVADETALRWDQYHAQQEAVVTEVDYSYPSYSGVVCPCDRRDSPTTSCLLCIDDDSFEMSTKTHLAEIRARRAAAAPDGSESTVFFDADASDTSGDTRPVARTGASSAQLNAATARPSASSAQLNAAKARSSASSAQLNAATARPGGSSAQLNAAKARSSASSAQLNAATARPGGVSAQLNAAQLLAVNNAPANRKRVLDGTPKPTAREVRFVGFLKTAYGEGRRGAHLSVPDQSWLANTYVAVTSSYAEKSATWQNRHAEMKRALKENPETSSEELQNHLQAPKRCLHHLWNNEHPHFPLTMDNASDRGRDLVRTGCKTAGVWTYKFEEMFVTVGTGKVYEFADEAEEESKFYHRYHLITPNAPEVP